MTTFRLATHHADDKLLCAACRTPWPCEVIVIARSRLLQRGEQRLVVHVEEERR